MMDGVEKGKSRVRQTCGEAAAGIYIGDSGDLSAGTDGGDWRS